MEEPRDVLTWIMFGLAVWLGVGALTAWLLFGASVSGSSYSWDEDDLEVANLREQPSTTVGSRYPAPIVKAAMAPEVSASAGSISSGQRRRLAQQHRLL